MATTRRKPGPRRVPLSERFWPKVDRRGADECWEWQATKTHGYGLIGGGGQGASPIHAHRVAWELTYGPIPTGLMVCHACDNRACCNPAHLFLGTNADNLADMSRKGRSVRGIRAKHAKLTEVDVRAIRTSTARTSDLAREYGVSLSLISTVRHGKAWRHV